MSMATPTLIKTRDALKGCRPGKSMKLRINCNNNFTFDETKDCVIWDDVAELLVVIRNSAGNVETNRKMYTPYSIIITGYSDIQSLEIIALKLSDVSELYNTLPSMNLLSADAKANILENGKLDYNQFIGTTEFKSL